MKSKWRDRVALEAALSKRKEEFYSKFLSVVLDSNSFSLSISNSAKGYLRAGRYDLLLELADQLGRAEHATATDHYVANQLVSLIKKVPRDLRHLGIDPEKAAISKFLSSERRVGRYNLIFSLERKLGRSRSIFLRAKMRDWIRKVIGDSPNYTAIWKECGFGPGASVGVTGNATHLAAKLLSPRWSVTPTALPYALAALRSHPQMWEFLLLEKEGSRFFSWDPVLFEQKLMDKVLLVDYNKVTLVPKTAKIHRTIAVEPLLNGYLQKGIDTFLRRRLFRFGIDLNDQSRNQELARQGSIPQEDPYSTIDLSEASDSISLELAKDLLPPDWFYFLNSVRSPSYLLNGSKFRYNKFCSMGNGFCFPLETLIFASACEAIYDCHNRNPDYSVYGDDIIVRSAQANDVLKLLRVLGFRHNPDKTFLNGPFRESCGADWYLGEDVRPVTLKELPDCFQDYFSLHNQTLRSWRTTAFFAEARELLRAFVDKKYRFVRPYKGNTDTAFEVDLDLFMTSPFAFYDRRTWSWRWMELESYSLDDKEIRLKARYNLALLQAALRGSSSSTPFTKRRNTRTRVGIRSNHGGHSTWLPSHCPDELPGVARLFRTASN